VRSEKQTDMNYSRAIAPFFAAGALFVIAAVSTAATKETKTIVHHEAIMSSQSSGPDQFFPESNLHEGETGYALTVFNGTKIERFGVEILGVLHKINNGRDWILIKVTSGPSVTDNLNIAEGMRGSPV